MSPSPPIRLLLVEDDSDVAASLGDYLAHHGVEVDFAADARLAERRLAEAAFDLLLLDIELPGEDGIGFCRRLREQLGIATPVLFLTASSGLERKLGAFAAGALDYVVKPFAAAELLARIRAIVARERALPPVPRPRQIGAFQLDSARHLLCRGEQQLGLSAIGLRIFCELFDAHPGRVSRSLLIERLWQGQPPPSDPLRMHIHQLRRAAIEVFGQPLIATCRGVGYRFDPESPA